MQKVIVEGGRDFRDYERMSEILKDYLFHLEGGDPDCNVEIVSGGAWGADKLGEKFAKANLLGLSVFPADWKKHGKSAGYLRNSEMADYADMLIAFWDGKSKGTKHMIDIANRKKIPVEVVRY
jgi:hypothetical protein